MSLVEKRYAEALVNLSFEQNAIDLYQEDLALVSKIYAEQEDFRDFLRSPEIDGTIKRSTLQKVFSGQLKQEVVNLLMLLMEKGRISFLPDIYREFVSLADEKRNILQMTVLTPFPLDEAQIARIKEKYGAMYRSSSVKAEVKLDKSLIGGVRIIIGDKVIDGTVAGQMKALKESIEGL